MAVVERDVVAYCSAVTPDNDTVTNIGGAVDLTARPLFAQITLGNVQCMSSSASDTTQTVTAHGAITSGAPISEVKTLNGATPVPMTTNTSWARLNKAIKSATTAGDVALEAVTATHSGNAQSGTAAAAILASTASATDGAYKNYVLRVTGGTGANQIRRIVRYTGATKEAIVNRDFSPILDTTSVVKVSAGMVFEKTPNEVMQVRQLMYRAASDAVARTVYDSFHFVNTHPTLSLTSSQVLEQLDTGSRFSFALATGLNDTGTNGAGNNRFVAPSGYTFNSTAKGIANAQEHTPGASQKVWLKLDLAAEEVGTDTNLTMRETGQTAA